MTKDYFGENTSEWKWKEFESTLGFPISKELLDWVIGQDRAIVECKLCVEEWIHKLKWLKERQWWKGFEIVEKQREASIHFRGHKLHLFNFKTKDLMFNPKPQPKDYLPAGPFLLLLGDAGTGKSLLGRAMSGYMTDIYKKNGINLYDVCTWQNRTMPSEPKISIHPTPEGKKLVKQAAKMESKKGRLVKWGLKAIIGLMIGFGTLILGYLGYQWLVYYQNISIMEYIIYPPNLNALAIGITAIGMGGMLYFFSRMMGGMGGSKKGIGGAENTKAPKLLIDNSSGSAPFVDATGHGSAQLFGSIAWDPYQTGDLGTPEHQRVTAGDVHRAHLGVLYIDEIKNLTGGEAVTLLTVLEDGQLPVALRSQFHGGDTAAMSVATEPIPCMVFLIAAGNMDSLCHIHPALMDRMTGYGKVVYMNNCICNTEENRRKYVQFIVQETKRFNLLPFTRDACIAIIDEARKKSGRNDRLTCYFRQMISILKTASTLAMIKNSSVVTEDYVKLALGEHCKSIQKQLLERTIEERKPYLTIDSNAEPKVGQIYGLGVTQIFETDTEMIGSVLPIRASIIKKRKIQKEFSDFTVTGVNEEQGSWVQNSIQKVRRVFLQIYKKDPSIDFTSHIDFAQEIGVDGPSAGVAMTLALISAYTKKKIRQDVTVTGEINIKTGEGILVTPIGGTHAKITAAQNWGFKKVCVPQVNYEKDINPSDYTIKVVGCKTLEDYIKECFIDE